MFSMSACSSHIIKTRKIQGRENHHEHPQPSLPHLKKNRRKYLHIGLYQGEVHTQVMWSTSSDGRGYRIVRHVGSTSYLCGNTKIWSKPIPKTRRERRQPKWGRMSQPTPKWAHWAIILCWAMNGYLSHLAISLCKYEKGVRRVWSFLEFSQSL